MNRRLRRAFIAEQHKLVSSLPEALTPVQPEEWPPIVPTPIKVWRSRRYLVQLYQIKGEIGGLMRLSICRSKKENGGRWQDGLTWDELQEIKRLVGFGDSYAVEIYPRDRDLVNDANMRHLWLLPEPLPIGWFR